MLEFNHIDCPLAIGYLLAQPSKQAYDAFRRTIRYSTDDYGRYARSAFFLPTMCKALPTRARDLVVEVLESQKLDFCLACLQILP